MKWKIFLSLFCCFSLCLPIGSVHANIPEPHNNPIDRTFTQLFQESDPTAKQRLIAEAYSIAWQTELARIVGANARAELSGLRDAADAAFAKEIAKWNGGTGGPGAALIAEAQVYRQRALELIKEQTQPYTYGYFAHVSDAAYIPLVTALLGSELYHYDAFSGEADAYTKNMTIYQRVIRNTAPAITGKLPHNSDASHEPLAAEIAPERLYADTFASGAYTYPDAAFASMMVKTRTGARIVPRQLSHTAGILVLGGNRQGDQITLHIMLTKIDQKTQAETPIGTADVILQTNANTSSGFAIAGYQPNYENLAIIETL